MTQFLHDDLVQTAGKDHVRALNIVRGDTGNKLRNVLVKLGRAARACATILLRGKGAVCYISLDANRGMINTLAYASCARLRGAKILIHHHSQSHIDTQSGIMARLARVAGPKAVHICICDTMADELQARYPAVRHTAALSNIISINAIGGHVADATRLRLGHMSKLSFEKGLRDVIGVAEQLLADGVPVTLALAGNYGDADARRFTENAKQRMGDALIIAGPVYGAAKVAFLRALDVFLFPTRYANETQGIVNLEALSVGAPIIAFGRGCIRDDLAGLANWVVPTQADYIAHAVTFLSVMHSDRSQLQILRGLAAQRFTALKAENTQQVETFRALCLGDADA